MTPLEKYFDENNWENYVNVFKNNSETKIDPELDKFDLDEIIKIIITYHIPDVKTWLDSHIPALDNEKPINCITNKKLTNRLKEYLLRFPQ